MHLSSLAFPSDMTSSCTVTSRREMCRISRRRGGYRCCVWAGRSARVWVTWPPCWTAWRNSCGTRTASLLDRPAAKHGRKQWLWSEHRTLEQEDENVHGCLPVSDDHGDGDLLETAVLWTAHLGCPIPRYFNMQRYICIHRTIRLMLCLQRRAFRYHWKCEDLTNKLLKLFGASVCRKLFFLIQG